MGVPGYYCSSTGWGYLGTTVVLRDGGYLPGYTSLSVLPGYLPGYTPLAYYQGTTGYCQGVTPSRTTGYYQGVTPSRTTVLPARCPIPYYPYYPYYLPGAPIP